MNFSEMLIMCGPSGVECEYSVYSDIEGQKRANNNHWLRSSSGVMAARGAEYNSDYEVLSLSSYRNGAITPHLMTISSGVPVKLIVTQQMIEDNWELIDFSEVL